VSPSRRRGRAKPGSLAVAVGREGTVRSAVSAERMADCARRVLRAEHVTDAMLSITLLDAKAMARLNQQHLGHRGATDVISFGFRPEAHRGVIGDVYICPAVARENAARHGCGVREELLRLVVHGTLHVLGHEHPVDAGREGSAMWKRQELLLSRVRRRTA
jgi:probable rRNA maturation factor